MRTAIVSFVLAALSTRVLSSPLEQANTSSPAPTAAPTCTVAILKQPSFQRICTNWGKTLTSTSYTNCGGCSLETRRLGVGLPCRTFRNNSNRTVEIVTSCKPSLTTTTKTVTSFVGPTVRVTSKV